MTRALSVVPNEDFYFGKIKSSGHGARSAYHLFKKNQTISVCHLINSEKHEILYLKLNQVWKNRICSKCQMAMPKI